MVIFKQHVWHYLIQIWLHFFLQFWQKACVVPFGVSRELRHRVRSWEMVVKFESELILLKNGGLIKFKGIFGFDFDVTDQVLVWIIEH